MLPSQLKTWKIVKLRCKHNKLLGVCIVHMPNQKEERKEQQHDMPCCCDQDDGVENRRRVPQASHAMISISKLIHPLLAQFTELTT
ncbi:hypothetical protein OIU77_002028 [Salix suchowensis]|uniref:Uncharacterized protein n=1 Tax=Salix suchowensis TaxID=1278906 RepID=A0ABQ9B3E9_9ROSI|nr:hypothetical protein OIU77_002028 [Salix suchowensis]